MFQTDFGTVGLMVCYDVFFADPARVLTLKGSELLLMPIERRGAISAKHAPSRTASSWPQPDRPTIPLTFWIPTARSWRKLVIAEPLPSPPSI